MPEERVYVAVDAANLLRSCRDAHGDHARVDFQVLRQMPCRLRGSDVVVHAVAYVVLDPARKHETFSQVLRAYGYDVRSRTMRHKKGVLKPMHTDWDVGITIDALDKIEEYDTFVLVSGDGDFSQLLEYLRKQGKQTLVLSFEGTTSRLLYESADELYMLGVDVLTRRHEDA